MRKITIDDLAGKDGKHDEKLEALSRLPDIYLCNSVIDFSENRGSIPQRYSTIVLKDLSISPIYDDEGYLSRYLMSDGGSCISFLAYDDGDETEILWPEIDRGNINPEIMEDYLGESKKVDGILLCYDKEYDNPFLMKIIDSYKEGIRSIMGEIWPES
ncbi:MAG: hypothetical protein ACLFTR_00450 [Candidatus Woesearchaeota archaeon]